MTPTPEEIQRFDHARKSLDTGRYAEALEEYLALKSEGYLRLDTTIGWLFANITPNDLDRAMQHYQEAAKEEDAYAQHALAWHFHERGDLEDSQRQFLAAARNGHPQLYHRAGRILQKMGRKNEAFDAFEAGAKAGDPFASRSMALILMRGEKGVIRIPVGLLQFVRIIPAFFRAAIALSREKDEMKPPA